MHFPLFLVSAALFAATVDCLPLDSSDQEMFLPGLIGPDSSSDLTASSDILADVNSYPLISNDADFSNSDLFAPSSSDGSIASSPIGGSAFNSLQQIPNDEVNLFNSDPTAPDAFRDSTVGSDVLGDPQNWLEPSFTQAGNPSAPSANEVSTDELTLCCGHGESLVYYCTNCEFADVLPRIIGSTYCRQD